MQKLIRFTKNISNFEAMKKQPWHDRESKDPDYALKRPYAKEAALSNCWIFYEVTKTWYTPEEFMADRGVRIRVHKGKDDAHLFHIADPLKAHQKHLEYQEMLIQKNNVFLKKVIDYFEFKRKVNK